MIPKIVHQLWLAPVKHEDESGAAEPGLQIPKDVQRNMDSWTKHHPDIDHRLWREEDVRAEFADADARLFEAIDVARFPTMRSNLIRLALLIRFGGYWSDLKNVVDRPFLDELTDNDLVLAEHQPMPNAPPRGYLTNSFLGATPNHPFLATILDQALAGVAAREEGSLSKVTGLVLLNYMMKKAAEQDTIPVHHFLSRETAWQDCMHRVSASYQSGGRHWSKLQQVQSLYLDGMEPA